MRNILERGAPVLELVARERMLLVFDFDGTLAPIVDHPASAAMRPTTRRLLRIAALLYPCAVLSGRSRSDLVPRVDRIPLVAIVGNHGAEAGFGPVRRSLRNVVVGWKAAIEASVGDMAGVEVEDKGLSIAIHYRHAAVRSEARRASHDAAATLSGARVFGGRAVVNVVPTEAHDKGAAVGQLLARSEGNRALYVGDDITDEDAFRSEAVAVGIRVGRTHLSAASYYVPDQAGVDELLRALVRARRRQDGLDDDVEGLERAIALLAEES
jgi:trehalose 6-phosphate phosphatase